MTAIPLDLVGGGRRETAEQRDQSVGTRSRERERGGALRRGGRCVDQAGRLDARAAEIGDRDAFDREPARVQLELRFDPARFDVGVADLSDRERERHVARPFKLDAGEHAGGDRDRGFEIDLVRAKRGVEPRRAVRTRRRIGDAPFDLLVVDVRLQPIHGDRLIADDELAAGAERRHRAAQPVPVALDKGPQRARIMRLDAGGAGEFEPVSARFEPPAQAHLGQAGRAEFERLDIPLIAVHADRALHALHGCAADRERVDIEVQSPPHGRARPLEQGPHGGEQRRRGRAAAGFRRAEHPVEIDLASGERSREMPVGAQGDFRLSRETEWAVVGPILKFDLLGEHAARVRLHLRRHPPWLALKRPPAGQRRAGRPHHRERALVARARFVEPHDAVGFGDQRPIDPFEAQAHFHAVLGAAAGHNAKAIRAVGRDERAFPANRSGEGPQFALKRNSVERQGATARTVAEHGAPALDRQPFDGEPVGIDPASDRRRLQAARGIDADEDTRFADRQFARAPFPAHQRTEREFEAQRARGDGRVAGRQLHAVQNE